MGQDSFFIELLPYGNHQIKFAFESMVNAQTESSNGHAYVNRLFLQGTKHGGAIECKGCAEGTISEG